MHCVVRKGLFLRQGLLAAAASTLMIGAAFAQSQQRIGDTLCDIRKLQPREYSECLRKAQDDSDRALRERISTIAAIIDKTPGMQPAQKTRWRKAVEDGQGLWMRFRNAECQELTPFETASKTRVAEEQRVCILDYNALRMNQLSLRYPASTS
jgi:uncharacterized protein YecT (DUF1311 family)